MKTNSISAGLAAHERTITTTRHLLFRRAWLWTGFLAFATIAFGPQPAQAAVTEAWVQRYGSEAGSADSAYKVVTDAAGNVIVAGSSGNQTGSGSDMVVIKYSGAGVPLWTNRYNGSATAVAVAVDGSGNVFVTGSSATIAYSGTGVPLWTNRYNGTTSAVAVDGSGNVFVTGSSHSDYWTSDYATIAYSGAGVSLWTNRYNGPANGYDEARAVAVDGRGNVVVTGWSGDNAGEGNEYATIAYSGAGVPLWTNRYNGTANHRYYNQASAVAVDSSGNVVVTGSSGLVSSFGNGNSPDYATIAYSGAGVPLWTNRYNGPANGGDVATAVAVDGSGNVFVTGWSWYWVGGAPVNEYTTIAYSSAGVPLWTKRYNGLARAVAVDGSGNVFVTGRRSEGYDDYATIAYSGAGVPLWTNLYHGPANGYAYDEATAVAVDGSGNVFVTGSSGPSISGGGSDFATIAYSGAGVALWTNRYGGREDAWETASAMAVDSRGNVVVTGYSAGGGGNLDYATIAYSGAGVPLWTNRYNGTTNSYSNRATGVAVDGSGNVFVTGTSVGSEGDSDYATIAYSGAGLPLWTNRYNGGEASALAVDGSGNVFVTGGSGPYGSGGNSDYLTIAYSGAGVLLWTNRYNGPANSDWGEVDIATAVAVDGRGNVVVTGHSHGDYYTAKYSGADGSVLWQQRYNGPENFYDYATAVAVDGSGNVVVTGTSHGTNYNADYYTAKYSGADGSMLWEQRYNGPANGNDYASAVAVDASGNVVVTGHLGGPDSNIPEWDYYTAKYAAANGALLWEKHYNGPANTIDSATAVAVDASGNVVVTGHSDGDFYTAKYAAADGATLWEKRFNGPFFVNPFFDFTLPPSLALGPNGMIAISGSSGDYATVVYRDVPAVSVDLVSTGIRLRVTGLPGHSYNLERAPALTGPWSTISTQTPPASGLFEYLDTNPPVTAAFYRTSEP